MFILIEWERSPELASIILDECGFNKGLPTLEEAESWAMKELGFEWKVVEIG